jgi:hypothetical protein
MNSLVTELQMYLEKQCVVFKEDTPGEFGVETMTKAILYMEYLKS